MLLKRMNIRMLQHLFVPYLAPMLHTTREDYNSHRRFTKQTRPLSGQTDLAQGFYVRSHASMACKPPSMKRLAIILH